MIKITREQKIKQCEAIIKAGGCGGVSCTECCLGGTSILCGVPQSVDRAKKKLKELKEEPMSEPKFKVGDEVMDEDDPRSIGILRYTENGYTYIERHDGQEGSGEDGEWEVNTERVIHVKSKTKGEETMNKTIIKLFPKTDDAVLVEKHLGDEFKGSTPELMAIILEGKASKILALAKEKEAESKKEV